MTTSLRPLTPVEARVLGTLMEKARTVPDSYPLTLNMVVTGCNQKTARDPIMQIDDEQAQLALQTFHHDGKRIASRQCPGRPHAAARRLTHRHGREACADGSLKGKGPMRKRELVSAQPGPSKLSESCGTRAGSAS